MDLILRPSAAPAKQAPTKDLVNIVEFSFSRVLIFFFFFLSILRNLIPFIPLYLFRIARKKVISRQVKARLGINSGKAKF